MSAPARILASLKASIGDVVFGMEDGTVSIFGLVFGVAISTDDPKTVLIAGASGAAAAAVSMMAGAYLDAESVRDARRARRDAPIDAAAE
jgi:VIT1/CCC1 family predicted Fe2+/Mn2+ transporter